MTFLFKNYITGVDIFVIAVGDDAAIKEEMNKITRRTDRYLKVNTATDLLTDAFVKKIVGDTCDKCEFET